VSRDDETLAIDEPKDGRERSLVRSEQSLLYSEAQRLLEFKRQHITRQNQTPCPECAVPVSVQARKCPHCGSEIADYTHEAREALGELNSLTAELAELQARELSRHADDAQARSAAERWSAFIGSPRVRRDLSLLLPAGLLLFVVLGVLRVSTSGLVFWLVTPLAGALAWLTLRRSGVRHLVVVDLYRSALGVGLGVLLCSAIFAPREFWPGSLAATVAVRVKSANLRQEASPDARVVGVAEQGERLRVTSRDGRWYRVKTDDGEAGWVYADLVE
jgi:hypothetical protein